jgi:nucleotide-binding universal stress UspA family protein
VAYKRILFGTDGTARAAASSHVATGLAKAGKAELIVAHVWERPEGAQAVLDAAVTSAQEAGVKKVKGEL